MAMSDSIAKPGYQVWKPGRQDDAVGPYRATLDTPRSKDRPRSTQRIWSCKHQHPTQAKALLCANKKLVTWVPPCAVCGAPCQWADTSWVCTRRSFGSEWDEDHDPMYGYPED